LSYADAERRDAARGAGASHLVDQRRGQAGAAATKRVTDRRVNTGRKFFGIEQDEKYFAIAKERIEETLT